MPGIVGLITTLPKERAQGLLSSMVRTIRHDASYEVGTWIDERQGVYVGWAVRKGVAGGMPFRNEQGDLALVFCGEEYPDPGILQSLKARGHAVDAIGPSYLVHVAEEEAGFPASLNGRFHGLLVDRNWGAATLFNDRYGIHRLYYHESKDGFYFAAEAKAILEICPELRASDPKGLGEWVACGCVLENRTLFKDVRVLPPASAWVFRRGRIERKAAYFDPAEWENQSVLDPESYYNELRDVFSRNLPRYFSRREGIGMSLTGGLDTRMIMAWARPPKASLPCYSFGGMFRDTQDVRIARKVADACGQSFSVIPVGEEFLARFAQYAERTVYLTDGCVDVRHSADLYANERAAQIAPVRMTGNYGGEVLRRVRAFKPVAPAAGVFEREFLSHVDATAETYEGLLRGHPLSFAVFRQTPWHHYGLLSLEQTQLQLRSPYLDNDFVRTVFRAPESTLDSNDVCLRLIAEGDRNLRRLRTDRGLAGEQGPILAAVTRMFLELTFKAEYAYDYGMPQWFAPIDHLLSGLKPERIFLGRHKFYHFRVWYRDALSAYVREMLLDERTLSRPYLQRNTVEAMVRGHLKGDRNYTSEIHKVLTLELIHRIFLDSNSKHSTDPEALSVGTPDPAMVAGLNPSEIMQA